MSYISKAAAIEKEQDLLKEKAAFEKLRNEKPRIPFEDLLSEVTVDGYELDDSYWTLFSVLMDSLPWNSISNKGRTLDEFWQDAQAVGRLYMNMYGWVDQDLEGFGLIGNLGVSLSEKSQCTDYEIESFDFSKAIEEFKDTYMVL